MRKIILLLALCANLPVEAAETGGDGPPQIERYYCTQFGPFFIRFDDDKAAGVFAILPNDDLGSVVGELSGHKFKGEWIETDNRGEIILHFSDDWLYFDAEYTVQADPENWLGAWSGRIRPDNAPASFEYKSVQYRCG